MNRLEAWQELTRPPTAEEVRKALEAARTKEDDGALRLRMLATRRRLTPRDVAKRWPEIEADAVLMAAVIRCLIEQRLRKTA
jgi:hypothetical protein